MATPPTVNEYDESTFNDNASNDELSSSASWIAGDIVLVFGGGSNNPASIGVTLGTPTVSGGAGTGLTFSLLASVNVQNGGGSGDDATAYLWSATAAGTGSGQIASVTGAAAAQNVYRSGICVIVCRGSSGLGTPVTLDGSTAKTISVTTAADNSIVAVMLADWNQVGDVTVTATPSGTVRHASAESGQADFFFVTTNDLGSAGAKVCGIASHTGTVDMSGIAVEIKGIADIPYAWMPVQSNPSRRKSFSQGVSLTEPFSIPGNPDKPMPSTSQSQPRKRIIVPSPY